MKAHELEAAFKSAELPDDLRAQRIICTTLRALRDFLVKHITSQKGLGGIVLRALYPKTAEGLKQVVTLLDEYLDANCGINLYP